ncbi:GNAT family N-acetyltransferase [Zooshikella harenae]|uniref:GNAT family N-acetyltransferase n=1 Tax=Zooshikella harenae TaxID=2827238 RepID=A0ABS5ZK94_9GAMM|nr:GNAT family N-acetyltransferase [Zooshikella harenae]MBU2713656.1 GNAT family N-acetyltransferase [Zooshikella harenae]
MMNRKNMIGKLLLNTPRLIISQLDRNCLGDEKYYVNDVVKLFNPKVLHFLPDEWKNIKTKKQVVDWLKVQSDEGDVCFIKLKKEQKIVGLLFLYGNKENELTLNIGYLLNEQYWGKGYASELLTHLIEYLRKEKRIKRLIAGVEIENKSSIRLLTKCGFIQNHVVNHVACESIYYELELS